MFNEEIKKIIQFSKIQKYRIKINKNENLSHKSKCGDEITFKITKKNNKVNIRYDASGCTILFSSAYFLVKILDNKNKNEIIDFINKISNYDYKDLKEIDTELEIFNIFLNTNRFDCFLLPYKALKETLTK